MNPNDILAAVRKGWGWKIGTPTDLIAYNAFGNVIVRSEEGKYLRITPEDLKCVEIADSVEGLQRERSKEEFRVDWEMQTLVEQAQAAMGSLSDGECYHLVIPSVLGGAYDVKNIKRIALVEWLMFSGEVARQIENVPDGTQVKFKWI